MGVLGMAPGRVLPWALGCVLCILSAADPAEVSGQTLDPPAIVMDLPRTSIEGPAQEALVQKLEGSWKLTGYHLWDPDHSEYMEVARRKDRIDETGETFLFRPNGTFRHIMSDTLWFTGKWTVDATLGAVEAAAGPPRHVVLAVDVSGTMKGDPIAAAREAALALVDRLGPKDRLALVTFGTKTGKSGFGRGPGLRSALKGLKAHAKKTRLHDGVDMAWKALANAPSGAERTIVVISDGKDEGSDVDLPTLLDRVESGGIQVHAVGYSRIERKYLSTLKAIARASGGGFHEAGSAVELGTTLETVFASTLPAVSVRSFVLHTTAVRGSIPSMRREHDYFVGTFVDRGRELMLFYVGERWDRGRMGLRQGHRFERIPYGER